MRSYVRALLCVALCAFLAPAGFAQQAPLQQFQGFSLDYLEVRGDAGSTQAAAWSLSSTGAGLTVLSLDGLAEATYLSPSTSEVLFRLENVLAFGLTAESGYRIARIEYSGTVHGIMEYGKPPEGQGIRVVDAGYIVNTLRAGAEAVPYASGPSTSYPDQRMFFFIGQFSDSDSFRIQVDPGADLQEQLQLSLYAQAESAVTDARWCTVVQGDCRSIHSSPADAALWLTDVRLTVYTEAMPVPEPRMWLMLLLGLVPVRLLSARRTHSRA